MKRIFIWPMLLLLTMASCRNNHQEDVASADQMEAASNVDNVMLEPSALKGNNVDRNDASTNEPIQNQQNNNSKIIRSGNISLESKKIEQSKANLDALLKKFNAYYEQENTSNNNDFTSYNLTIRIPANAFDNFLSALEKGEDKLTDKNISAQDVSIQYYDLESRLKSKRAFLERYQNMVSSAKNVKDLLEIQEQIRQLQEDIDSSEATMRNLSNQVNYCTLTVNLFEYQANLPMGSNSFWVKMKDSLVFGWNMIQTLVLGIIGIWPIWIIAAVIILTIQKIRKNKRAKKINS
ncbi:DUF4349 domain-containing protein [Sphingobacterium cellulitidis]|uniref:DUF4349 domain-containing protein n=1 Tax=Sphingobacterium cellulitidis TaxID=1768011 RepID=UPI003C7C1920